MHVLRTDGLAQIIDVSEAAQYRVDFQVTNDTRQGLGRCDLSTIPRPPLAGVETVDAEVAQFVRRQAEGRQYIRSGEQIWPATTKEIQND